MGRIWESIKRALRLLGKRTKANFLVTEFQGLKLAAIILVSGVLFCSAVLLFYAGWAFSNQDEDSRAAAATRSIHCLFGHCPVDGSKIAKSPDHGVDSDGSRPKNKYPDNSRGIGNTRKPSLLPKQPESIPKKPPDPRPEADPRRRQESELAAPDEFSGMVAPKGDRLDVDQQGPDPKKHQGRLDTPEPVDRAADEQPADTGGDKRRTVQVPLTDSGTRPRPKPSPPARTTVAPQPQLKKKSRKPKSKKRVAGWKSPTKQKRTATIQRQRPRKVPLRGRVGTLRREPGVSTIDIIACRSNAPSKCMPLRLELNDLVQRKLIGKPIDGTWILHDKKGKFLGGVKRKIALCAPRLERPVSRDQKSMADDILPSHCVLVWKKLREPNWKKPLCAIPNTR